jgi:hypothetical protein
MMKRVSLHVISLFCILVLVACGSQSTAVPTLLPQPTGTNTSQPTVTDTPVPTHTSTPAALILGERQSVETGGYSLKTPSDFKTEIRVTQTTTNSLDNTIMLSMAISPRESEAQTLEAVLTAFLAKVEKGIPDLNAQGPQPAIVGGLDGLSVNVTGTFLGRTNTGQITIVDTGPAGFFIAFAFVADGADGKRWESEGSRVASAVLNSIEFFEPLAGTCVISSDPSYGYTKENPIRVSGDAFGGPARERAYLDNLAGPKGEKISYERSGSQESGDTILDAFVITGLSKPVTLYMDEYSYSEPQAPVGFTCLGAFSLTKP